MKNCDAALGILANGSYRNFEQQINKDEVFIIYSDGITEAMNETGQFFGKERLLSLLDKSNKLNSDQIGHKIISTVGQFRGEAKINDDLSLVILKKK